MDKYLEIFKINKALTKSILNCSIGIERESLRIHNGEISSHNHPFPKENNPFITTDYAEAQVEFVSDVFEDTKKIEDQLSNLYDVFLEEINSEYLWPYSLPISISEENIKESIFNDESRTKYREYLGKKYGKEKQLISGIHFNISFSDDFINQLCTTFETDNIKELKNQLYLNIIKNYEKTKLLTILFFGATPISPTNDNISLSQRNGVNGYKNQEDLNIDYSSINNYKTSVEELINNKTIYDAREVYEAIRPKNQQINVLETILDTGIKYIEIRNIDINPYIKTGISAKDMEFLKYIVIYSIFDNNQFLPLTRELENKLADNFDLDNILYNDKTTRQLAQLMLEHIIETFTSLEIPVDLLCEKLEDLKNNNLIYQKLIMDINEFGYYNFLSKKGLAYKMESLDNSFNLKGFENMELSTVILVKEALKKGLYVSVLDKNQCFIQISNKEKTEFIVQATKTSKDNYVSILKMENKVVSKKLLMENNINTPKGDNFTEKDDAYGYAKSLNEFVIKPKSTNFGLGISIFTSGAPDNILKEAINHAFSYDKDIIIEKFAKGSEYRFLVINNSCVGVLERIPANVTGNGQLTISELIDIKNKDNLRGEKYNKPLEKIKIDLTMVDFLAQSNKTTDYIPKKNELVYLRKNSNISTGGDSIDYTDICHAFYKEIAIKATKAMDAFICGVDIIIDDITQPSEYSVLEVNFNPAIHIHCYPYKGKNRNIGKLLLEELGF